MAQNIDRNQYGSKWKHKAWKSKVGAVSPASFLGTFHRQFYQLTPTVRWHHKHTGKPKIQIMLKEYKQLTPSFIPPPAGPIDPANHWKHHPMKPKISVIYAIQIGPKTRPC